MKFTLIKNANIVLENGIIYDGELLVCDNKIKDYGRKGEVALPENYEIIDGNGKYVGPVSSIFTCTTAENTRQALRL